MDDIEYVKLLLAKVDGQDVTQELIKYRSNKEPHWFNNVRTKDAVLKFSSSKVPGEYRLRSTNSSVRGLRFGQYRPDRVEVIWVGRDFDIKDKHVQDALYSGMPACLVSNTAHIDIADIVQKYWFAYQLCRI